MILQATVAGPDIKVLDSGAMLAVLKYEAGAVVVTEMLEDPDTVCIAHAVNVCEVFYDLFRSGGEERAQEGLLRLAAAKMEIRADLDPDFWQDIGRLKGGLARIALADCFGIALTRRLRGEFVMADHHELDRIASLGLCPIRFFRQRFKIESGRWKEGDETRRKVERRSLPDDKDHGDEVSRTAFMWMSSLPGGGRTSGSRGSPSDEPSVEPLGRAATAVVCGVGIVSGGVWRRHALVPGDRTG